MKLDPPMLCEGPVSGKVYVVTHGKLLGEGRVEASVKYDVTDQFEALAETRANAKRKEK